MRFLNKAQNSIIFALKMFLYIMIIACFFVTFGSKYDWLLKLSRTTGVTLVTFIVLLATTMAVYGGYQVGRLKSKPICISMSLATLVTDLVAHFEFCIMCVNEKNNDHFVYESPHLLLITIALQVAFIISLVYFGNYVYFYINKPEKCCIVTSSEESLNIIAERVSKYKKQYQIVDMIPYTSPSVFEVINRNDTVFLYDIPQKDKIILNEYCYAYHKNIYYNFEMSDIVALGSRTVFFDDKPIVSAHVRNLTIEQRVIKRTMDIVLSLLALILFSPFALLIAIAIKAEDKGHVFYRQARATKGGKVFLVYKFRTMKEDGSINVSVKKDDKRITKVGKFLRKYRLDEVPQFINILKGDMSLVGPRPEMVENVDKYTEELPEFTYRLRVKSGLTGFAQIAGKYNTSPKDKLVLDLMYIEKYSLWLDVKLLLQTVTVVLKADDSTEAFRKKEKKEKPKYRFTER